MMLITAFIICWAFLAASRDYATITLSDCAYGTDSYIGHKKSWYKAAVLARLLTMVMVAGLFADGFWDGVWVVLYMTSLWWLVFDEFLNSLRGKYIFYVGSFANTDKAIRWIARKTKADVQITSAIIKIGTLFAVLMIKI
jgi:hypothetical protein